MARRWVPIGTPGAQPVRPGPKSQLPADEWVNDSEGGHRAPRKSLFLVERLFVRAGVQQPPPPAPVKRGRGRPKKGGQSAP